MSIRKGKTGLTYFSFDVDFFQDPKIEFVSAKYGIEGEIIAIKLLCRIYRDGYYMSWDEDQALLFLKRCHINPTNLETLQSIIDELIFRGFFDKTKYKKYKILTSNGIQRRYLESTRRRKSVKMVEEYLITDISDYNVDIFSLNVDSEQQSKVKKSKVKKEKEINILYTIPLIPKDGIFNFTEEMFDEYQEIYPGMDIHLAMKFICKWNNDNPKKRKSRNGIKRHITTFLNRLNDQNKFRRIDGNEKNNRRGVGSFLGDVAEPEYREST